MKALVLTLAAAGTLASAAPAAAPPIAARALAVGTMQSTTIHAAAGSMILESFRIAPGGSFGWHVHGAPVAVVVASGTLTVFDPKVGGCKPFRVSKGQSFVEPANHVHLARNDTARPVQVYAMYLGVPTATEANAARAKPAGCAA